MTRFHNIFYIFIIMQFSSRFFFVVIFQYHLVCCCWFVFCFLFAFILFWLWFCLFVVVVLYLLLLFGGAVVCFCFLFILFSLFFKGGVPYPGWFALVRWRNSLGFSILFCHQWTLITRKNIYTSLTLNDRNKTWSWLTYLIYCSKPKSTSLYSHCWFFKLSGRQFFFTVRLKLQ